jgi:TetR/AcrR family transcriptional regulator, tetracycline repressor protein
MERGRGERAGLSRERVLDEAQLLVGERGVAALTMRALADRLGVAPNTLYSHVADRDDLVDGVLDRLLAGVEVPHTGTPSERLGELMHRVRRALLRTPELTSRYLDRRTIGPEALRIGDACSALLREAGLDPALTPATMKALMVFTIGSATVELPQTDPDARDTAARRVAHARDADGTFAIGLAVFLRGIG